MLATPPPPQFASSTLKQLVNQGGQPDRGCQVFLGRVRRYGQNYVITEAGIVS